MRRDGDGRYRPGMRMLQLAAASTRSLPVLELADEHLRALAEATGETAYLVVLQEPGRGVYLRQIESPRAIRHAMWLGRSIPLEGTAVGAALAGSVGPGGYATNRGSIEPDSTTAAAPILDSAAAIVAAISVIGPTFRISDAELARIGSAVAAHARALSAELGAPAGRGRAAT